MSTLAEYLDRSLESCRRDALNAICYRVSVAVVLSGYRGLCTLRGERPEPEDVVLRELARRHPSATVEVTPIGGREVRYVRYLGAPWTAGRRS